MWIFRVLIGIILVREALSAPTESGYSNPSQPEERPNSRITLSSFGHLAIDLGLGGAVVLGAIGTAEAALYLLKQHKQKQMAERQASVFYQKNNQKETGQTRRELDALQLLMGIAEKYAEKVSSNRMDKNKPLVIPKEIHKNLEAIFTEHEDGTSYVQEYHDFKKFLAPLIEFEDDERY